MKQISFQVPDVTIQQIRDLAQKWGEPKQRHNTPVVARCVERMWQIECSGQHDGKPVQAEKEGDSTPSFRGDDSWKTYCCVQAGGKV